MVPTHGRRVSDSTLRICACAQNEADRDRRRALLGRTPLADSACRIDAYARTASLGEHGLYDGNVALPTRLCGSSSGLGRTFADAAVVLGRCLAEHGFGDFTPQP